MNNLEIVVIIQTEKEVRKNKFTDLFSSQKITNV